MVKLDDAPHKNDYGRQPEDIRFDAPDAAVDTEAVRRQDDAILAELLRRCVREGMLAPRLTLAPWLVKLSSSQSFSSNTELTDDEVDALRRTL